MNIERLKRLPSYRELQTRKKAEELAQRNRMNRDLPLHVAAFNGPGFEIDEEQETAKPAVPTKAPKFKEGDRVRVTYEDGRTEIGVIESASNIIIGAWLCCMWIDGKDRFRVFGPDQLELLPAVPTKAPKAVPTKAPKAVPTKAPKPHKVTLDALRTRIFAEYSQNYEREVLSRFGMMRLSELPKEDYPATLAALNAESKKL